MSPLHFAVGRAAVLTAMIALPPAVNAGTTLQRCEAADGVTVYTDQACAAIGAVARPMPTELLTRVAREQAPGPGVQPADMSTATRRSNAARRALGCARSTTQLATELEGAIALGDVNRLAESYHWAGLSHANGQRILQQLDALASQPLAQAHYLDARIGGGVRYASAGASGVGGSAGAMQLIVGDEVARSVTRLDVERYHGCYFVRF
ncbi:hypothetical protein [Lysobacter sp. D1-1-M9]|uniref:hypothetical protein n=1 Tax=Novilysobacter longmucuonensis TaxID=3098603 RepID=UPI002FC6CCA6